MDRKNTADSQEEKKTTPGAAALLGQPENSLSRRTPESARFHWSANRETVCSGLHGDILIDEI